MSRHEGGAVAIRNGSVLQVLSRRAPRAAAATALVTFSVVLVLALALALSGCSGTGGDSTSVVPDNAGTGGATAGNQPAQPTETAPGGGEPAEAEPEPSADAPIVVAATVAKNVDGDTAHFTLADGTYEKVRFIGIDTPESTMEHEAWGKEASNYTADVLTVGRTVFLETDAELRDRYGRLLAYIWLDRPQSSSSAEVRAKMLNAQIALAGLATPLTIQPNSKYADEFAACVADARGSEVGMWKPGALSIFEKEGGTATAKVAPASTKVWATKSGERYHRPTCRHLTSTKFSLTLGEAVSRGLTPCGTCKPPALE